MKAIRWRVAWLLGLLSRRSHYTASGKPKQAFASRAQAQRAAASMTRKTGRPFDVYRCWLYCRNFHFGGSVRPDHGDTP